MKNSTEIWCPVVGYEGHYEVSDLGRVRSVKHGTRMLRPSTAGRGYLAVHLSLSGRVRTCYVHHLVAEAFIGPRPDGLEICHGNGDIRDARAENLRYDTHHANMRDSLLHGTHRALSVKKCSQGHDLTPENVYRREYRAADGGVKYRARCKTCLKVKNRRDYENWRKRHSLAA